MEDLPREVPVVEGLRGIDALIALESHEGEVESGSQRLGIRRLARPRLTLQQQRATQPQRQPANGGEGIVGEIAGRTEPVGESARVGDIGAGVHVPTLHCQIGSAEGLASARSAGVSMSRPVARSPHSTIRGGWLAK